MAEFQPITISSQEELNKMFSDRAESARRAEQARMEEKYAGFDEFKTKAQKYDADIGKLNEKISALDGEKQTSATRISELEAKIRDYETASVKTRIARETGLPFELADRLAGDTEEAMREDAEKLRGLMKPQAMPMYRPSGENATDGKDAALKDLLKRVRNEN